MTIYHKLAAIQQEIKCPKNLENTFGGYKYRSAESILESLKPIMAAHKVTLMLNDDIRMVGDRIYVMAEAKMIDLEGETSVSTHAFAREALERPKMDAAQLTGSASSYARKYALNGLLLLDDVKDPDTNEFARQQQERPKRSKRNEFDFDEFAFRLMNAGVNIKKLCDQYKVEQLEDLSPEQVKDIEVKLSGNKRNH